MTIDAREYMVAAAARTIRDREIVFVGMRLPLIGYTVAQMTHAPNAIGFFDNGLVRDRPADAFLVTMGDTPNQRGALAATTLVDVLGLLQGGRVDVGFLGGAEVDALGNLNTTRVGGTRLPGSGGGSDIAAHARRCVYIMDHEKRRFVDRVAYITSKPRGPVTLITTLGVFALNDGPARALSLHPGVDASTVRENSGFAIACDGAATTPALDAAEAAALRRADPDGFWTRAR